jgi:cytochrome oxidase assembly protein ShyY1
LRPGWILSHLFVLACVVGFLFLANWQFQRLMGRRDANAVIAARQIEPVAPVDDVMGVDSPPEATADAPFRQVRITGTYQADDQVLIRNRSKSSSPGYWVVTPLQTRPGEAVVVNRGWIPIQTGDEASADFYAPPTGTVTVVGLVVESQEQSGLGVTDPAGERLDKLSRVDVPRLQEQVDDRLYPLYVNLVTQDPAQAGDLPEPVEPPVLDEGSPLNSRGLWLIFAGLTVIVYPLLLRRTARNKAGEAAQAAHDAAGGVGSAAEPGDDDPEGAELTSSVPPR